MFYIETEFPILCNVQKKAIRCSTHTDTVRLSLSIYLPDILWVPPELSDVVGDELLHLRHVQLAGHVVELGDQCDLEEPRQVDEHADGDDGEDELGEAKARLGRGSGLT